MSSANTTTTAASVLQSGKSSTSYMMYGMYGIIGLLVVAGIGYYFYKGNLTPILDKLGEQAKGQTVEVMMFYVDWCPHCKTAGPEWELFESRYNNTTMDKTQYVINSVNCTEETPEIEGLISKYKIEGYPTVKMVLGDKSVVDFNAKITNENLSKFIKSF